VRSQVLSHTSAHMESMGIHPRKNGSLHWIRRRFMNTMQRNAVPPTMVENTRAVGFKTMVMKNAFPASTSQYVFCRLI